jgi:hypothetical protein
MYWSGCQSTGAEMRKYLTAAVLVVMRLDWWGRGCTYGCRLAGGRRRCRAVGFAARPDLIEKSRVRQIVPGAAASGHGGRLDTCCAATRSSVQCLELGRQT